jgi:uncharacterized oligopeptide transporter (OPT) family protein
LTSLCTGALVGALVGLTLPLIERALPKAKRFLPSLIGLGLAFVMPGWISRSMFKGALIALVVEKARPKLADQYVVPVASGVIARENLMAVLISALMALGVAQT